MALKAVSIVFLCASFHIGSIDAFRSDYTYIVTTKSFYKYHKESVNWHDAVSKCKSENALLYYPEIEYEHMQVKSVLKVKDHIWIGISDLLQTNLYETVDGRAISQVYNNWHEKRPVGRSCLMISIYDSTIWDDNCDITIHYICKIKDSNPIVDELEEVKTISANASEKIVAALELQTVAIQQQFSNQTTVLQRLIETMQLQAADQFVDYKSQRATSENQTTTTMERLIETIHQQAANQEAIIEGLAQGILQLAANQTSASEKQAEAMQRLALALEKLAEDNEQLDVRSQQ